MVNIMGVATCLHCAVSNREYRQLPHSGNLPELKISLTKSLSGRCTEMAISLGAMRDSQRMCSMGWRRKTDASQAASESDFQKHIAVVFFLSFFFFFFNFFAHTAGHVGS